MAGAVHLAVDATGIKHSGGAVVLLDFLETADTDPRVSKISVFCSPASKRRFNFPEFVKVEKIDNELAERSYAYRIIWFQSLLGKMCERIGADLLFCMTGAGMTSHILPHVTLVQQSLPFSSEYWAMMRLEERLRFGILKLLMRASCKSARHVIVQTPTMKSWIAGQLAIPESSITVIIPSVNLTSFSDTAQTRSAHNGNAAMTLLYVGSDNHHKNVATVLAGMRILRERHPEARLLLTFPTGHRACKEPGVVCLGYLQRRDLLRIYLGSDVLVMPSLVETVGLPMLEAMSVGLPVLAADRPYAHDICGDAACYFDPHSPTHFADIAGRILEDPQLRHTLSHKGKIRITECQAHEPYTRMLDVVLDCNAGTKGSGITMQG